MKCICACDIYGHSKSDGKVIVGSIDSESTITANFFISIVLCSHSEKHIHKAQANMNRRNSIEVNLSARSINGKSACLEILQTEKVKNIKMNIAVRLGIPIFILRQLDLCWAGIRFDDEEDLTKVPTQKANFHLVRKTSINSIGSPQPIAGENEPIWPHIEFI